MGDDERKQEEKDVEVGSVTLLADDVTAMIDHADRLRQVMQFCIGKAKEMIPEIAGGHISAHDILKVAIPIFNRATAAEPMELYIQKMADLLEKKDGPDLAPTVFPVPPFSRNVSDRLANLLIDMLEEDNDLVLLGKGKDPT